MRKMLMMVAMGVSMTLAAPAFAEDVIQDTKDAGKNTADTGRQAGHRTARALRRADGTSGKDAVKNGQSKAASSKAQGRKNARHVKRKVRQNTTEKK